MKTRRWAPSIGLEKGKKITPIRQVGMVLPTEMVNIRNESHFVLDSKLLTYETWLDD